MWSTWPGPWHPARSKGPVHPFVLAALVRGAINMITRRGHGIASKLVQARHPDSDGGRLLTSDERRDLVLALLVGVAEAEQNAVGDE